jgi:signal peptide peptidase SppA
MNNEYSKVNVCQPEIWKHILEDISDKKNNPFLLENKVATECKTFDVNFLAINPDTKVINIVGLLVPDIPKYFETYGIVGTSYNEVSKQIEDAVKNPSIKNIILYCNSGGGLVNGVSNCANTIYNASQLPDKNVIAYVDGMCASGAYWLISQCNYVLSTETSEVGGIGVYSTIVDDNEIFESKNGKVYCLRSGPDKGIGEDKITDSQLQTLQENINDLASIFNSHVAKGRNINIEIINEIATGRVWVANKALSLNLINEITNKSINNLVKDEITMSEIIGKIENKIEDTTIEETKDESIDVDTEDKKEDETIDAENVETKDESIVVEDENIENKNEEIKVETEINDTERVNQIMDLFSEIDLNFAKEMINENKSVSEAKEIYLNNTIKMKKSLLPETKGIEPIKINEAKKETNDKSYYEFAKELCESRNVSMLEVGKIIEREFPDMRKKLFNQ